MALQSTTGVHWRVRLNANNRVKTLVLPDRTLDYDYDPAGKITMVQESSTARRCGNDTLVHEYAHHIWGYGHGGSFDRRWESLKGRTERCQR